MVEQSAVNRSVVGSNPTCGASDPIPTKRKAHTISPRTPESAPQSITSDSQLAALVDIALTQPRVAVDLEANGFHRYPERVCLVQLGFADRAFLIDPIAIDDMSPLGVLLASPDVVKIFHSADYDVRSLDRDWSFHIDPLFDTSIAAAFCGYTRLGLGALLKDCLDVDIPKEKKLQRADWTVRPITDELREYAAEDVRHLERLAYFLHDRLDELGRVDWVREECERLANVRFTRVDAEHAFLLVKGSKALNGRGLAILRALHDFREDEAIMRDRPPFKVFSDSAMVAIAEDPKCDISKIRGIGSYAYGRRRSSLRSAIAIGMDDDPVERPRTPSKPSRPRGYPGDREAARKMLRLLKQWRLEVGEDLEIDPALVWPAASLERIAADESACEDEMHNDPVRNWQCREFGDSLLDFIDEARA